MNTAEATQLDLPILIAHYHRPARELMRTRASLLVRLKNWSDDESWQEFFDTYWRLIFSTAVHAGLIETEAQDVVQETIIAVARSMPTFQYDRARGSFKAWLLNLTGWRIADQLKKRGRGLKNSDWGAGGARMAVEDMPSTATSDLDRLWDEEWNRNILDVAIRRVKRKANAKEYQAFDLCVFKEWSVERVSQMLGFNTARVSRAKYRIKILLTQEVQRLQSKEW